MYSWNVASMKKSIMYDVLNVIDKANRQETQNYIDCDHSLLSKDTFDRYNRIFELAREYKDSIAAVLYVPESDASIPRFTLLYSKLTEKLSHLASFADMLSYIESASREESMLHIMEACLQSEEDYIRNDLISQISKNKGEMLTVAMLNETKLPQKVKFSLVTLLFNYDGFLCDFIEYLTKLYNEIEIVYNWNKDVFRYASHLLKSYLAEHDVESLLMPEAQLQVFDGRERTKYTVVLSLMRLEYSREIYDFEKAVYIQGVFYIQRMLHDIDFKIF